MVAAVTEKAVLLRPARTFISSAFLPRRLLVDVDVRALVLPACLSEVRCIQWCRLHFQGSPAPLWRRTPRQNWTCPRHCGDYPRWSGQELHEYQRPTPRCGHGLHWNLRCYPHATSGVRCGPFHLLYTYSSYIQKHTDKLRMQYVRHPNQQ